MLFALSFGVSACSLTKADLLPSAELPPSPFKRQRVASLEATNPFDVAPTADDLVKAQNTGVESPTEVAQPRQRKHNGTEIVLGTERFVDQSRAVNHAESLPGGDVVLNFSETDIREVAQAILGDVLGLNFVVDIESQARITLRTNRPIAKSAVLATLETTLNASGLALAKEGDIYRIIPTAKAKGGGRVTRALREQPGLRNGYGIVAVPLKFVAPSQMAKLVEPMAPANSILNVDDSRSLMVVAAIGPEMEALLDTISMFDVDGMRGMSFGYFKVDKSNVADVARELKSVLQAHAKSAAIAMPQIVPLTRLNSLLVISSKQQTLELVEQWIDRLDETARSEELQLYVYHVKNRRAKELAALLENVYSEELRSSSTPASTSSADEQIDELRPGNSTSALGQPSIPPDDRAGVVGYRGANSSQVRLAAAAEPQAESASDITGGTAAVAVGRARIVADEENNTLLIRARYNDYQSILTAVQSLDLVAPLVLVEVTIAEIKLKDGLQFGIEWFLKNKQNKATFSSLPTGQILSAFPGFSYFFSATDVAAVLNALADVTDVRIVSSPKMMVRENKTASLQVGDQVPVLTSSVRGVTDPGAPIVQTVQYYDTGVILKVTPQVNAQGLVTMDVVQEVSNVADEREEGIESPTIQQRKLASSISIQSGEAVVLGGMMREARSKATTGIPLLAELPSPVGDVFKTHDNSKERTELMVVITPRVVWGRSDANLVTDELRSQLEAVANTRDRGTRAFIGQREREAGIDVPNTSGGASAKD